MSMHTSMPVLSHQGWSAHPANLTHSTTYMVLEFHLAGTGVPVA